VDLAVVASAASTTGLEWDVEVKVSGLASDQAATLRISADHPSVNVQLDPACDPVGAGDAVCEIRGSSTLQLMVLPDPTYRTTLTFSVTPAPALDEVNGEDNVTRVTLAP
jgi:hypothetical protein